MDSGSDIHPSTVPMESAHRVEVLPRLDQLGFLS